METTKDVPKGHFAIYVGEEERKRFVIPLSYLNHQWFRDLLGCAEEEFGFSHRMGGLTIPCTEEAFLNLSSHCNMLCDGINEQHNHTKYL